MPPDSSTSLLRRMAGTRETAAPARGAAPNLERALPTSVLRVAGGIDGLGLGTAARTTRMLDAAVAFEGLDERALCLMIDPAGFDPHRPGGPTSEVLAARTGLLAFSPTLTDALVEVQTIGRVDGPARPPRRPTRIDAALVQPFARAVLEGLGPLLPPDGDEPVPGALRGGSFIAGPESLSLILTARRYLRLDLELRLADGARQAGLTLILPVTDAPLAEAAAIIDPEAGWKQRLEAVTRDAPVRLEAVLPPMKIPLSRLLALKVGDLVPLEAGALATVVLHGGSSGITLRGRKRLPRGAAMIGRLGQLNGRRAVKIAALPGETADPAPVEASHGFGGGLLEKVAAAAVRDHLRDLPAMGDEPNLSVVGGRS